MNCYFVYDPEFMLDGAKMVRADSEAEAAEVAGKLWGYDKSEDGASWDEFMTECVCVLSPVTW